MRIFGFIVLAFLGFSALSVGGFALKALLFPAHTAGNILQSQYDISDKTFAADNVLYNYEWFKDRYEAILATETKVETAHRAVESFQEIAGARETWTFEDKTEYSRLAAVEQGLRNHLEDLVAEYNSRSKQANRNIFQDGLIPNVLEIGSNILR